LGYRGPTVDQRVEAIESPGLSSDTLKGKENGGGLRDVLKTFVRLKKKLAGAPRMRSRHGLGS